MTATVDRPTLTDEERTEQELIRARNEVASANEHEFDGLIDIAYKFSHAATLAMLAAQHAKIGDEVRMNMVNLARESLASCDSYLRMAYSKAYKDEPPF